MKKRIHLGAGLVAMTLVAAFFLATVAVELSGDSAAVLAVKTAIVFGLFLLVPSVMITGITGRSLAANRRAPLLRRKQLRTVLVAAIGITVLVPCAVTLQILAADGNLGPTFALIQAVELVGGLANLTLLGFNARDGRRLTAATRRRAAAARA
jgi:hypothetical protein